VTNTLATLPSYIEITETGTEILPLPYSKQITPEEKYTLNLHLVLNNRVIATLPLMELLKVKLKLWSQVSHMLQKRGYALGDESVTVENLPAMQGTIVQKVPLNKVNKYEKNGKDKENSMLPIKMDMVKTMAILDTGAGISIATKEMWIKWGKRALQKTRMDPQLARW